MSRGRTPRQINERMVIAALKMIEAHVDRPCPTRCEIMEWTGIPRRQVWSFLDHVANNNLIEVQVCDWMGNGWKVPKRRRLRIMNGSWTGWTQRTGWTVRVQITEPAPLLEMMEAAG